MALLALLLAAASFAAGAGATVALFAAGRGGRVVARVRGKLFPPPPRTVSQGWTPLATALHSLEWRAVPIVPQPERAGAFTRLPDGGVLAVTAHGDFFRVDAADAVTKVDLPSPLNLPELLASPLSQRPDLDLRLFRVNDILAAPRADAPGVLDLYASHHVFHADASCVELRLSHATLRETEGGLAPGDPWRTLVSAAPCVPIETSRNPRYDAFNGDVSGGRLLLGDDGTLLMTMGDAQLYEKSGMELAQDPATPLGKILRVDRETGEITIVASGVRNPQGLWRSADGRLWETEHGPRGGDELNLIRPGANYGWPKVSYGVHYDLRPWQPGRPEGVHDFGVHPVFAFVPSLGTSPLIEADATQFPNWRGDLIIGTLTTHELVRVRLEGDDAIYAEPIVMPIAGFRDLDVAADGSILALSNDMELLHLRNANGPGSMTIASLATSQEALARSLEALPAERAERIRTGAELFAQRCSDCHSLGAGAGSAPNLLGVVGRPVADVGGFAYSPALGGVEGEWTEARLAAFLVDPDRFAPGQTMPSPRLDEPQAQALVAYLAHAEKVAEHR